MRVFAALLFSSAVVLAPALAAAQTAPAPTAPTAPTAPPAPAASASANLDEVVCRNEPAPTGSRIGGGRECHTVREWNQRQLDSQNALLKEQQQGFVHPGG